ncbi:MAG: Crp/Fnr family transcriptional regulator [Erysipelothrix sp.]|nr:Crp/Fnr family transcriptional regulator [Erysipelothrix sp.]
MQTYTEIIKNTTLLSSLSKDLIAENLNNGKFRVVLYKQNNIVHLEGEACNKLEVILKGRVVVERVDEGGNLLTISEFKSDDVLGGNLLFSKRPYFPLTVSTSTQVVILEIGRKVLFDLFSSDSKLLLTYLQFVSDHAFILGDKIKSQFNQTIRESVMAYLLYETKKQNSKTIMLTMTKKKWAEKIGVRRTSLSRELAKMKKDGLILYDINSITMLK